MRLKQVFISNYKNLNNFTMDFEGDSFIEVFVGKNGSGKSNLIEAIIEIFRHLIEFERDRSINFSYRLNYEINGDNIELTWTFDKLFINGVERKTLGKTPLPENLLIYYSGHNETVAGLIQQYESSFRKRIRQASIDEARFFIGIGPVYKELLLAMLLMQPAPNRSREFISQKLGITHVSHEVRLVLNRPFYASDARFDIENNDESDRYWKPEGLTKTFLDRLTICISPSLANQTRSEGYFASEDRYILYFDIKKIQHEFRELSAQQIFRQFDNLKTIELLTEISISLQLDGGKEADISYFSDGQFQSVYIYAITELYKDRHCITLLDEPDSFLHPEWQFDFLKQVSDISEEAAKTNHVLMSSHSAATLCGFEQEKISQLKIDNSIVSWVKQSKKEAIHELSGSYIQYSEDESKLLIDNVIRSSNRPILFVEGLSDVSILNTAHKKLYPNEDISVLIQDAFDRGFLKVLFRRDDIFKAYSNKHFFALFDFDEAYGDWRDLGGDFKVEELAHGLCKKLKEKQAYAFMLPVPNNELKAQVWDDNHPVEKIKSNPYFCIEHIFWPVPELQHWFISKNNRVQFKGDKVKFAKEIVPTLAPECFEPFRPMFEFIKATITTA